VAEKFLGEKTPGVEAATADPGASNEMEAIVPRPRKARRLETEEESIGFIGVWMLL
jgi:hypothetical protein